MWKIRVEKKKKVNPAKQKILENYAYQREQFQEMGYTEHMELISILKANLMVFVTSVPWIILGIFLWRIFKKGVSIRLTLSGLIWFVVLYFVTIFVHEILHGVGWSIGTDKGWKNIYIGIMWDSLTPYCHCKEPLVPGKYLFGGLLPFLVLGIGLYAAAFVTGNSLLLWLSLINILGAGGDLAIMLHVRKYKTGYLMDHPTECGFTAFVKE